MKPGTTQEITRAGTGTVAVSEKELARILARPDITVKTGKTGKSTGKPSSKKGTTRTKVAKKSSSRKTGKTSKTGASKTSQPRLTDLERRFLQAWTLCGGPELVSQHPFHPVRRWRCDFYYPPTRTIIEIEGFGKNHQSYPGYTEDCYRYNEMTRLGYRLLRLTGRMIQPEYLDELIAIVTTVTTVEPVQ